MLVSQAHLPDTASRRPLCTYPHIRAHVHTWAHAYTRDYYLCICVHAHMCTYLLNSYADTHARAHTPMNGSHVHECTYLCTRVCAHGCACTHALTLMKRANNCMHSHTYAHSYLWTHTCIHLCAHLAMHSLTHVYSPHIQGSLYHTRRHRSPFPGRWHGDGTSTPGGP